MWPRWTQSRIAMAFPLCATISIIICVINKIIYSFAARFYFMPQCRDTMALHTKSRAGHIVRYCREDIVVEFSKILRTQAIHLRNYATINWNDCVDVRAQRSPMNAITHVSSFRIGHTYGLMACTTSSELRTTWIGSFHPSYRYFTVPHLNTRIHFLKLIGLAKRNIFFNNAKRRGSKSTHRQFTRHTINTRRTKRM